MRQPTLHELTFSLLTASILAACASNSTEASEPKPSASQGGVVVAAPASAAASSTKPKMTRPKPTPIAKLGGAECRAPGEDGCASCCEEKAGKCSVRSWKGLGAKADIEPWYNSVRSADNCPVGCHPCASCTTRAEKAAKEFVTKKRGDCNCATEPVVNDACFTPDSCGCYCSKAKAHALACPDIVAKP